MAWAKILPEDDGLLINAPGQIRANWDALELGTDSALLVTNFKVASNAAIMESKLLFSGSGHEHTGSTNGKQIPLASGVTGQLPIANGGTGSAVQNFVDLTTAQVVAGIKTFLSSPIVPTPTTDMQASTMKYVNDKVALIVDTKGFTGMQVFTSSGTWTKPAGIAKAKAIVIGGAGGGGASGVGNGGAGGNSSFSSLSANGGAGGTSAGGGAGGSASGGTWNITGGTGAVGSTLGGTSAAGAAAKYPYFQAERSLNYGAGGVGYQPGTGWRSGGGGGGVCEGIVAVTGDVSVTIGDAGSAPGECSPGTAGVVIVYW